MEAASFRSRGLCFRPNAFQFCRASGCLWSDIHAVFYQSRIHEMVLQVGDAFQERCFMSHRDVIEQN